MQDCRFWIIDDKVPINEIFSDASEPYPGILLGMIIFYWGCQDFLAYGHQYK